MHLYINTQTPHTFMQRIIISLSIILVLFSSCTQPKPVITDTWHLDSAVMVTGEGSLQNSEQNNSVWRFDSSAKLMIAYANGKTDSAGYKMDTVDNKPLIRFQHIDTVYPEMDIVVFTDKELKLQADMMKRSFVLYFRRVNGK